ncbi:MAG: TetR family transcriptional regulator [Pseudonocardiaceae bacterium]
MLRRRQERPMTLRERKKALTRSSIQEAGLRLFVERGYDATTLDHICDAAVISRRTLFRYFGSKEDVVLSTTRDELARAGERLRHRPAGEPLKDSLFALVDESVSFLEGDRDRQIVRSRLLANTPALAGGYLKVLTDFELLLRGSLAERSGEPADSPQVRLAAAAAVTAFRVASETWVDNDGGIPLKTLAHENLDHLLTGCRLPGPGAAQRR